MIVSYYLLVLDKMHIGIKVYMSWVDGSVGQPKASKPEVPGSTPGSS